MCSQFSIWDNLLCMQDGHHRNWHILFNFCSLDPHDLHVRILAIQVFVHFCRIFCYGHAFDSGSIVGDLVCKLLSLQWESQFWFLWGFPGHLYSKCKSLRVLTAIFLPPYSLNFWDTSRFQFLLDIFFVYVHKFLAPDHTLWLIQCSVRCNFHWNVNQFVCSV